jgi:uncharacterized protein (DUF305 family)
MRRIAITLLALAFMQSLIGVAHARQDVPPATPVPHLDICGDLGTEATPVTEPATVIDDASFDLAYVDMMITHHQNAIIMLLIADGRLEHPELQKFVQESLAARRTTIQTLLNWRSEHYSDSPWMAADQAMAIFDQVASESPGRGGVAGAREIANPPHIDELCFDSEQPFDLMMIDHLLPHTSGALLLSDQAEAIASDATLAATARDVSDVLQREIDALYAWRMLWFPDAGEPHLH